MSVVTRIMVGATLLLVSKSIWAIEYPEFPTASFMEVEVVAENMRYNNVPMRVFNFRTGQSVDAVEAFYNKQWEGEVAEKEMERWTVLSHRSGDFLLTVQIGMEDELTTHGTLSAVPVFSDSVEPGEDLGQGVNTMPGAKVINDIQAVDGGRSSRTVVLEHPDSVRRTAGYYSSLYQRQGWARTLGDGGDLVPGIGEVDVRALGFQNDSRRLHMAFSRVEGKTYTIMVFVE